MKLKILFFLILGLFVAPIHANDLPINYPADVNYVLVDGKIYTQGGEKARLGFFADCIEDAVRMAEYYEDSIRSSAFVQESDYAVYLSDAEIVHVYYNDSLYNICVYISKPMDGYLIDPDFCMQCESAFIDAGFSTYSFYQEDFGVYYADAEYSEEPEPEPEPQEPTPPEGMADGCVIYYQGAWRYTSELEGPTADVIFRGPSLYADTEEDAERCASEFADFLAAYDWPWYGEPAVLPWSEPKVYKCYVIRDGAVSRVFWRVFFQDYTGDKIETIGQYDSAYMQCLNDYGLQGAGTGGYNSIEVYGSSAVASASNTGSAQLNGSTLAQSDSGTSSVKLASGGRDVTVAQYTAQKVEAEGDAFGASEVVSEASVSEGSDGSINVTNHTTINTNIELGNAPEGGEFEDTSELEEKEVSDFFSREGRSEDPPAFVYVESYNDSYRINYGKLWEDIKQELSSVLPIESLEKYFDRKVSSGSLPVIPLQASFPEVGFFLDYTIDFNEVLNNEIVRVVRQILGFLLVFETAILCLGFVRG